MMYVSSARSRKEYWQVLLSLSFLFAVLHSQPVFYVKVDDNSICPSGVPDSQCKTLYWYSHNINASFISNATMVFLKGRHLLETFVEVANCHNFTITGTETASIGHDGQPHPTSWIDCSRASGSRTGLFFTNSDTINIFSLGIDSCGGKLNLKKNFSIYVAFAFEEVADLVLERVIINNTKGFGLHCDNIFGNVIMVDSVFMNARGNKQAHIFGGNVRFWFGSPCSEVETQLTINRTWFLYGRETQKFNGHYCNASGLQVLIYCPGVYIRLNNITAKGNRGINGGNLALSLTDFGFNVSRVIINNSDFEEGQASKGGGIRLWCQIETKIERNETKVENFETVSILTISHSRFYNNIANITGGAMYITHYVAELKHRRRQIIIANCKFVHNKGNAAAMEILQTFPGYIAHFTPQFSVHIDNSEFVNNRVPLNQQSAIMELIGTKSVILSNCNFTYNNGSVFSLRNSNLNFYNGIHFSYNHAAYGAALKVCDSSLVFLHEGTNISFLKNTAYKGGAVYAQQGCLDTEPACLFQPALNPSIPIEEFDNYIQVKFVNNSAEVAGDAIYGGSLDYCYILTSYSYNGTQSIFNQLYVFQKIFDTIQQAGSSNISSNPRGVCFCDSQTRHVLCDKININLTVYPGQMFNTSVTTIGQFNGTTVGIIDASFVNKQSTDDLISLNKPQPQIGCTNLTNRVLSNAPKVTINFTAVTTDVNVLYKPINASLVLSLLTCPPGFKLIKGECKCNPLIHGYVDCNINTQVISKVSDHSHVWFGCNGAYNRSHCDLAMNIYCSLCSHRHCSIHVLNKSSFDHQCLPGRTGVLCGACKPGLSRVFGSHTKCKACSNWYILLNIPLYLLSGLVAVILLGVLNLTVTEGTISGLIVYANIMYTHASYLSTSSRIIDKLCWTFIALLNFDYGSEICFYNGMDSYQHMWFLYGSLLYYFIAVAIIVALCRRFTFFTRLLGRNIIKVLATLLFLMYSPIIYNLMQTFQYTHLHFSTINGTKRTRRVWYYDGNVSYFGAKHIPLFLVGILFGIALFWFTFSLLLIQCLQRRSLLFCFRWVEKLRPFFEAFTGPCRDSYRFWPGLLIFTRLGLYTTNTTIVTFTNTRKLESICIAIVCMIILSISCMFPYGVYKRWPINVLEFSFFLNLCITSVVWTISEQYSNAITYVSILVVILIFLGILIHHISARIKFNIYTRLTTRVSMNKLVEKIPFKDRIKPYLCPSEVEDESETTQLLPQPLPTVAQYREPLVGDTKSYQ